MKAYSSISIIYNPNSTGDSSVLAKKLKHDLSSALPTHTIDLIQTKHAGHGEQLAYDLALKSKRPLIISSSGDGGYHEVINGLMKAKFKGANPVAGLLPAGNANDHYRQYHKTDLVSAITGLQEQSVNLLKLQTYINAKPTTRFAHSYIGIGLTPKAGEVLNKVQLNPIKELWLVIKVLFVIKPVNILINGNLARYYSLIFSTVNTMSKVVKVAKKSSAQDGKFEITPSYYKSRARFILRVLVYATAGKKSINRAHTFSFTTTNRLLVQMDGEIYTADANSLATITLEQQQLDCIV